MSFLSYPQETNSHIHHLSSNSITFDDDDDDNEDFIDEDSNEQSIDKSTNKKKTLGRVKIKMAYIDNKIRRYTTFSKRKTGIMKKAYELATLTGTEVMLLVASETGHVYTYATPKLQPMITSETGKALIQTCLAKDETIIEPQQISTTLNNNDVILIDENQRKKRTNLSEDGDISPPNKRVKSCYEIKQVKTSTTSSTSMYPTTATVAVPLSCLINPNSQQQSTIDLNSLKTNRMNILLTPSRHSEPSLSSDTPLVLTLGHFPYQTS